MNTFLKGAVIFAVIVALAYFVMRALGYNPDQIGNLVGYYLGKLDFVANLKYFFGFATAGMVLRSKKSEFEAVFEAHKGEEGNSIIIFALVLFVILIVVVIPLLNAHGNANPGCLFIKTPACGN